jgi:hypothetical protein
MARVIGLPPALPPTSVRWGEGNGLAGCTSVSDLYLRTFRLSACGVSLYGAATSSYLTSIDTTEPCLVLPPDVFAAVRTFERALVVAAHVLNNARGACV